MIGETDPGYDGAIMSSTLDTILVGQTSATFFASSKGRWCQRARTQ